MIKRFFQHQTKNITAAGFILFLSTVVSALLGIIRNRLLASNFGMGLKLDIYFASLKIPSFITTVLVMDAISVAIIPLFDKYREKSERHGWHFISAVFNVFSIFLIVLSGVLFIFTPQLISLIMPGFSGGGLESVILLTRIMLLQPILMGISTIVSGVLKSFYRFVVVSLAPIAYNIGVIGGILFLYPLWGLPGLAWGVVFGSLLHLLIQLPALFKGDFEYFKTFDIKNGLKKVFSLGGPRSLSIIFSQANLVFLTGIASVLAVGSISVFHLASDFGQIITRLIAVSLTTAAYPVLSRAFSKNNIKSYIKNFNETIRQILYLVIPAGVLFFLLRAQIIRVILGSGQFGWTDTRLTAACAGIFGLGVFAQSLVTYISKSFGALHDNKTPAKITFAAIIFNIGAVFSLVYLIKNNSVFRSLIVNFLRLEGIENIAIVALPLAYVLMMIFQSILLLIFIRKTLGSLKGYRIIKTVGEVLVATTAMGVTTYIALYQLAQVFTTNTFTGIFLQGAGAGLLGLGVFIGFSWLLKMEEFFQVKNIFQKAFSKIRS